MANTIKDILLDLLKTVGPSGSEEQVISLFGRSIAPYVTEVKTDVTGNCIAHKTGSGSKVMLVAHADEVGLMIHYIDERGYLYFKEIGGVDTSLLPGQRISIEGNNGPVIGVIGKKPIHLQDKTDSPRTINPEDLWIDIGAKDKKDAEQKVQIGQVATIISEPVLLADKIVASKSLDDRIGLAILIAVSEKLGQTNADVYFVASAQEELGSVGAQTVTERILPDVGIAIDVTHATDYPTMSVVKDGDIKLGSGVVIAVGPNIHKSVSDKLLNVAVESNIPYQMEALPKRTGTDARAIQVAGTGVAAGLLSIPCRYMHTPNEVVSIADAESAVNLIIEYLRLYNN